MTAQNVIQGFFTCLSLIIEGVCTNTGILIWKIGHGIHDAMIGILETVDAVFEHRVTGMAFWVFYFAVQDLIKNDWVQTLWNSPSAIDQMSTSTWILIGVKMLVPTVGGMIAYKSDTWARKAPKIPA